MKIIGLTGPSGAGKGFCYDLFEKYDIPCIDTDAVYHNLLIPPSECVNELIANFGKDITTDDGLISRERLADVVFSDKSQEKLRLLNKITHKYVLKKTRELAADYKLQNKAATVVDAPLLFESGFDAECDFSIAVISDKSTRIQRIINRDGISEEKALMRVNSQKSDDFYTTKATYTVNNNSDRDSLNEMLICILKKEEII